MRTGDQSTMLRLVALAVLSMAMFVAAAASAEAKVFRGKTNQGRSASVVIGSDGLLRTAAVNWRSRCRAGRLSSKTYFLRPHDVSTPDAFSDAGTYRRRDGRYRIRFTGSITATRIADARGERWKGTFRLKALVTRRGRYVDTCRTGRLRFTLRPA
jgi:hypothetical protein